MLTTIILTVLLGAFLYALKWAFSPYFAWKKRSEEKYEDTFTIITSRGRQDLKDYLREVSKTDKKVDFSLLIPAYNEKKRLPDMLPVTINYLEKKRYSYEIIVCNDASRDNTTEVALAYANYEGKNIDLKVLEYTVNQGKGGAIRSGAMAARGDIVLMVDADGATDINDFEKCVDRLRSIQRNGDAIVAGSRAESPDVQVERKGYRLILAKISNFIVQTICGVKLKDTQCGFKFFTQQSAKKIFKPLHIRRWAFDVEMFMIANYTGIPYCEISVTWSDKEGSKLNVVTDSIQMARDYILIRLLYLLRLWNVKDTDQIWEAYLPSSNEEKDRKSLSPKKTKRE